MVLIMVVSATLVKQRKLSTEAPSVLKEHVNHLGRPSYGTGTRVAAGRCICLSVQGLGDVCALALPTELPTVVGAHECAIGWLYTPLCSHV